MLGSGRDKVRVRLPCWTGFGPSEVLKVPLRGTRGDPHAQAESPEADPKQQAGAGRDPAINDRPGMEA